MKLFRNLFGLAVIGSALFFLNSCSKETSTDVQSALVSSSDIGVDYILVDQGSAESGNPCYVLLFPLKVQVGRETVVVNSQEELDKLIRKSTTSNARPQILFPYGVKLVSTGEVVRITSQRDLDEVIKNCNKSGRDTIKRDTIRKICYSFVFPLTVKLKDGTTKTVNSQEELNALRRSTVGGTRFRIEFPFEVILADGTKVAITSREELLRLERSCTYRRNDTGGH